MFKLSRIALCTALLLIAGNHLINITHYPAYFDDEGIYVSRAWALLAKGSLAPYTFWYDHAPLGWMLIALWAKITGGLFAFGMSINSGRVFMTLMHLVSTYFVFGITKSITKRADAAFLALFIFSFSPLGVSLQRMVFLDNIMLPFVLYALYLLVQKKAKLHHYTLSAVSFGLAFLVKETALFFLPGFLGLFFLVGHKAHRRIAITKWLIVSGLVVSSYFLFAALRNELVASRATIGSPEAHVSLLETLKWQADRKGGYFLNTDSEFMYSLRNSWLPTDFAILLAGVVSAVTCCFFAINRKILLVIPLFTFSYIAYLIRGGIVNDQYIIPLLPFFSIAIATTIGFIADHIRFSGAFRMLSTVPVTTVGIAFALFYSQNLDPYIINQTANQIEAYQWIRSNTTSQEVIAADGYLSSEFMNMMQESIYESKGVHHYWELDQDPTLKRNILPNGWKDIDYVLVTNKLMRDSDGGELPEVTAAIAHSNEIVRFTNPVSEYEQSGKRYGPLFGHILIADGGDIKIHKRYSHEQILLTESWNVYKNAFIHSYGQVIDPARNLTTSEGQSYAMLRSVFMQDQSTFDGVWQWTKDHLWYREGDKLISWLWQDNNVADAASATDADIDIATALVLAHEAFGNEQYIKDATAIVKDIWEQEVVYINGSYYLVAGSNAQTEKGFLVNPSYFSPAAFELFKAVYPEGDWDALTDDMYALISRYQLPPNWIVINNATGDVEDASAIFSDSLDYGYDAFRTLFRIALHANWYKNQQAINYLRQKASFFADDYNDYHSFAATYRSDGSRKEDYESLSTIVGAWSAFSVIETPEDERIRNMYVSSYKNGFWGDKNNYYDQNWAWLGYALSTGNLNPSLPHSLP